MDPAFDRRRTGDLRRTGDRYVTERPGVRSLHSFSFGHHYDPANLGFGQLLAHNEELLAPGAGFAAHPHRDVEIVTWVLQGELLHEDNHGHRGRLGPGAVGRMSAGHGTVHSESNSAAGPTRFVQLWLAADTPGAAPTYAHSDTASDLARGGWVALAAGAGREAAVGLDVRGAVLWAARLAAGEQRTLPDAPLVHLFVASGAVLVEQVATLTTGDAVRLRNQGGLSLSAQHAADVLVCEMLPQSR